MSLWDNARVRTLQARLSAVQAELREALADLAQEESPDYRFATVDGPVRLSELFEGRRDLIVMHSMGSSCANCTMVIDGFNGLYPHIRQRAAFAVSTPDAPEVHAALGARRGWTVPLVSHAGTTFAADMGFVRDDGGWRPGVSAFRREAERIVRVAASDFHAETDFCAIWRLFDLLPDGRDGWRPVFQHEGRSP